MIIRSALDLARQYLKKAGVQTFSLDSEVLLAHLLNIDRAKLVVHDTNELDTAIYNQFMAAIERRVAGECVAYITGYKAFRHLDMLVNKDVLVPRPDTEILVEAALEWIDRRPLNSGICLLDICSGSGAVALALLDERPYLKITASDISAAALVVLKQNYERLLQKQTADIKMQPLTIIESDLFSMIHKKYTIIVANPPYIKSKDIDSLPKEIQQEPRLALDGGEDGLVLIKKIIINAKRYLETSGALFIEAAPDQMYDIAALLANAGYKNIVIKNDLNNLQRVIGAER